LNNGEMYDASRDEMLNKLAIANRKILIYDEVDENSVFRAIYFLMRIRDADKRYSENHRQPINIYINSCGGSVYDGLSLISLIESMKREGYVINTINAGYAMSMAFLISIVGTNRIAYQYSTYMLHDIAGEMNGKLKTIQNQVEELTRLRKITDDIITKYTNISKEELDNVYNLQKDYYLGVDNAIQKGVCDRME